MTDQQFDPLQVAAQMGGTTDPTALQVANSEVFADPEPASPVTSGEADVAEILAEGEATEAVPGPYVDGEPVEDSR